ncbi:hypothetical protein EAG_05963 [Camponotus floridanus]|uniref:Uncharacterized protein n=1 Tax=Camponotus floridanus TaxID=104421 RepID=E2AY63_CAMFO|nr:hypothetical protein EAG_05963 [Camponotus floridanus]
MGLLGLADARRKQPSAGTHAPASCVTWRRTHEHEDGPYCREPNSHGVVLARKTVHTEWHKESRQRTRLLRSRSAHTLTPLTRSREKPESRARPRSPEAARSCVSLYPHSCGGSLPLLSARPFAVPVPRAANQSRHARNGGRMSVCVSIKSLVRYDVTQKQTQMVFQKCYMVYNSSIAKWKTPQINNDDVKQFALANRNTLTIRLIDGCKLIAEIRLSIVEDIEIHESLAQISSFLMSQFENKNIYFAEVRFLAGLIMAEIYSQGPSGIKY